jgi:hypothetical protein
MSSDKPSPSAPPAQCAIEIAPAELDLAGAMRLVESALASAGVATTERERLACAKTLLRLAPSASIHAGAEDYAAVLAELGRG